MPEQNKVAPKLSEMAFAAKAFATLDQQVESAQTITERMQAAFNDAHEDLKYRVDKRIALYNWTCEQIEAAEEAANFYRRLADHNEEILEELKAQVRRDIESEPSVTFRGRLGLIFTRPNNPALEYTFGSKHVTPDMIKMFGVDPEYVIEEHIPATVEYSIDNKKLKADLKAGKTVPWANLKAKPDAVIFPSREPEELEAPTTSPLLQIGD
jgi:uncharacterized protein YcgL (UPF0745 family)